jgi:hypothetical protein
MASDVEKLRVPVRLCLAGSAPVSGNLFVTSCAESREGPESVLDRLNDRVRVLPFERAGDKGMLMVVRSQVNWVLAVPEVPPRLVQPPHFLPTREEHVLVRMHGGSVFEGELAFEMPHERNRVSDFLNAADDFFPLRTPQGTVLVRKDAVLDVELRGEGAVRRAA